MKMTKSFATILGLVCILLAGEAEAIADSLIVEQGSYFTRGDFVNAGLGNFDNATFSGNNFAVSNLSTHESNFFDSVFITGVLEVGFGTLGGTGSLVGLIQVGDVSCQKINFAPPVPDCGAALRFTHRPITIPAGSSVGEAPFTMTGQLLIGRLGLPNLVFDIEGSGIVTAEIFTVRGDFGDGIAYTANYNFSVPEPSTFALLACGLVAVGWLRWRGGKHIPQE